MTTSDFLALYCQVESEVPSDATCDEIDAEIGRRCGLTRTEVSARISAALRYRPSPAPVLEVA